MSLIYKLLMHFRLIKELLRYDLIEAAIGFHGVRRGSASRQGSASCRSRRGPGLELEASVCEALQSIVPFYWKRVQCLQRSVVTARVLRTYGAEADVVIGYRLAPFLAHAWVEVGGRIVNDSPAFQSRLKVLERF